MTRITNALKDKINEAALAKSGVTAKRADIAARRSAWAEAVRVELLGGDVEAVKLDVIQAKGERLVKSVPKNLRGHYFEVVNTRTYSMINLAGARIQVKYGASKIAPSDGTITADNPLVQQFHDLEGEEKAVNEQAKTVSLQVRATLDKFGTVKSLLKAWPEAKELLPDAVPESKPQLPALLTADLNALIGLPSEEQAAA